MNTALQVVAALKAKAMILATAESCTGGLVAAAITDIAGSSDVFDRGFVTYSNEAKTEMLGVPSACIQNFGAVSEETAKAMATGALENSNAAIAVAITGIAGPGGGSAEKPVGLVHFAVCGNDRLTHVERRFGNLGRDEIRRQAVDVALQLVLDRL